MMSRDFAIDEIRSKVDGRRIYTYFNRTELTIFLKRSMQQIIRVLKKKCFPILKFIDFTRFS